jgi:hypothetical protein
MEKFIVDRAERASEPKDVIGAGKVGSDQRPSAHSGRRPKTGRKNARRLASPRTRFGKSGLFTDISGAFQP